MVINRSGMREGQEIMEMRRLSKETNIEILYFFFSFNVCSDDLMFLTGKGKMLNDMPRIR